MTELHKSVNNCELLGTRCCSVFFYVFNMFPCSRSHVLKMGSVLYLDRDQSF